MAETSPRAPHRSNRPDHCAGWLRLSDALRQAGLGYSLTEVAHRMGFADSAHLSRTFRRMLGLAPSALLKE